MPSAWFGLNTGVSALEAAQTMLDTAAHNVSNANTPGYSRQRVGLVASPPFSYPAFNRSGLPGQIGTGVSVANITRVRDAFLDHQIGGQMALQGYWDARRDELAKVESVFPEPNGSGLGTVLGQFWNAWQDVATDPTSSAARSALIEQASSLATRFNRDAGQLTTLQSGADYEVGQSINQINDLATRIASLNEQIQRVAVSGDHPNDLMDQRDALMDQLNTILPVTQQQEADGSVTVLVGGTDLVNHGQVRTILAGKDPVTGFVVPQWSSGGDVDLGQGQLSALVEQRDTTVPGYSQQLNDLASAVVGAVNRIHTTGYDQTGQPGLPFFTGTDATTIAVNATVVGNPQLVAAASAPGQPGDASVAGLIADIRNAISYPGGIPANSVVPGMSLPTGTGASVALVDVGRAKAQAYTLSSSAAGKLTLTGADGSTQTIDVAAIAAGSSATLSFGQLGVRITVQAGASDKTAADLITDLTTAPTNRVAATSLLTPPQTLSDFYSGLVGHIGADSGQATQLATNQELVVDQLTQRRESTSGVSLDEEATDMIRFQHAYQAAARVITTVDEMLDQLINHTGLVGR